MRSDLVRGEGPEVGLLAEQIAGDRDPVEVLAQGLGAQGDVRDRVHDALGLALVGAVLDQEGLGRLQVDDALGQPDHHGLVEVEGVGHVVHDDAAVVAVEALPGADAVALPQEDEGVGVAQQILHDLLGRDAAHTGEVVAVLARTLEDVIPEDALQPAHLDLHHRVVVGEDEVVAAQTVLPEPGVGQVGGREEPELGVFLAVAGTTVRRGQVRDLDRDLVGHLELGPAQHVTPVVGVDRVAEDGVGDLHVVAPQHRHGSGGERIERVGQDGHDGGDEIVPHGTGTVEQGLHRDGHAAGELPETVFTLVEARQAEPDRTQVRVPLGVHGHVESLAHAHALFGPVGGAATSAGGGVTRPGVCYS